LVLPKSEVISARVVLCRVGSGCLVINPYAHNPFLKATLFPLRSSGLTMALDPVVFRLPVQPPRWPAPLRWWRHWAVCLPGVPLPARSLSRPSIVAGAKVAALRKRGKRLFQGHFRRAGRLGRGTAFVRQGCIRES
jgi:hypothetical protein